MQLQYKMCKHAGCVKVKRKFQYKKNKLTSSVYDCTVEDVEYIYNKLSLQTELFIDVFYIFNSTVVDCTVEDVGDEETRQ